MSLQQHENQTEESLHAEKSEKKSFFAKIRTWLFAFLAAIGLPVGMSLKNASTELTGGQGQGQMQ